MKERTQMIKIDLTRFKDAATAEDIPTGCGFATGQLFDTALISAATTLLLTDSKERTLDVLSEDEHVAFAILIIPNIARRYPSPLFDTAAESIEYYFTKPSTTISEMILEAAQNDSLLNKIVRDELTKA